jgi:hypothetical protein
MSRPCDTRGFAALISVLIISAILITLTLTASTASFFARADLMDADDAAAAASSARGCIEVALLKLVQSSSYRPAATGDSITIDSEQSCTIESITAPGNDLLITGAGKSGASTVFLQATVIPRPPSDSLNPGIPR